MEKKDIEHIEELVRAIKTLIIGNVSYEECRNTLLNEIIKCTQEGSTK